VAGRETYECARPYRDGFLTQRNTFQKYYDQIELQHLIEEALETDAVAVGLGIFYVFRRPEDRQDFVSRRTRRTINWEALNARLGFERPEKRALRVRLDLYERHQELLDDFFRCLLDLGRLPKEGEYERMAELREAVRSPNQAERIFIKRFGQETYDQARDARTNDMLVFLALDQFGKPSKFKGMSGRLQRDIKAFFGPYRKAREQAKELLFSVGDPGEIELACEGLDFGWDEDEAFLFHRSLLNELPPILRIYVHCAAKLYGDPEQADLIKIHKFSGKVTFQLFDDFDGKNLPELNQRIKVNLRTLEVDVFDHENWHEHQLLYFKERFVANDHSDREQMQKFSLKLRKLDLSENMGFGPTKEEFLELIAKHGLNENLNRKRKTTPIAPIP
jgi:DNA phosphorothioation-associated putative methyltransferase